VLTVAQHGHTLLSGPHQLEEIAEVAHSPIRVLQPEIRIRPEDVLQVLQQCWWQGIINGLHEAACAADLAVALARLGSFGAWLRDVILQHLKAHQSTKAH